MKLLLKIIFLTITSLIFNTLNAQKNELTLEQYQKISALFDEWDKLETPGVSVGVLSGNDIIYLENFGAANLQYKQNIQSDTRFRLAGMSPHFTAFAVLLLEERKQLHLDDDIRKYLPEFPEYEKAITIRHLLTHSSGLPGYWSLKSLLGFQADDKFTTKDAENLYLNY